MSAGLAAVVMRSVVEQHGGLRAKFDPTAWSTGELQLLNLARAVLKGRRSRGTHSRPGWRILRLDEPTSNIDRQTAAVMQKVIWEEFADYTVIAVEHRLQDVMRDLDWIVRMDKGSPAEMVG